MRIKYAMVAATAAAALLLTACTSTKQADSGAKEIAGSTGQSVTDPETYKLGLALPLTGSGASNGLEYRAAVELGVEDANKKFAADGITIELETADTQATAEGGVNAMNKLGAVSKTPAVVTAWGSVVSAGTPVAQDLGMALFNSGAQSPALIGSSPNLVNILPMMDTQLKDYAKYITGDLGKKKVGVIYVDNESGQSVSTAFKDEIQANGGEIVASESIRPESTDATAQVAKVAAAGPEFVYVHGLAVETAAIMKAAREANLKATLGSYAGVGESRVIRDAGQDRMNGMDYMSHLPADIDATKTLATTLQDRQPSTPLISQSYDPYFYAAPFLYGEAIKRLRVEGAPVTGENILAVLRQDQDIQVPIIGAMDLTDQLTFRGPTTIREIVDYKASPLDDITVERTGS